MADFVAPRRLMSVGAPNGHAAMSELSLLFGGKPDLTIAIADFRVWPKADFWM
jgi:hypothetical protein